MLRCVGMRCVCVCSFTEVYTALDMEGVGTYIKMYTLKGVLLIAIMPIGTFHHHVSACTAPLSYVGCGDDGPQTRYKYKYMSSKNVDQSNGGIHACIQVT